MEETCERREGGGAQSSSGMHLETSLLEDEVIGSSLVWGMNLYGCGNDKFSKHDNKGGQRYGGYQRYTTQQSGFDIHNDHNFFSKQ